MSSKKIDLENVSTRARFEKLCSQKNVPLSLLPLMVDGYNAIVEAYSFSDFRLSLEEAASNAGRMREDAQLRVKKDIFFFSTEIASSVMGADDFDFVNEGKTSLSKDEVMDLSKTEFDKYSNEFFDRDPLFRECHKFVSLVLAETRPSSNVEEAIGLSIEEAAKIKKVSDLHKRFRLARIKAGETNESRAENMSSSDKKKEVENEAMFLVGSTGSELWSSDMSAADFFLYNVIKVKYSDLHYSHKRKVSGFFDKT